MRGGGDWATTLRQGTDSARARLAVRLLGLMLDPPVALRRPPGSQSAHAASLVQPCPRTAQWQRDDLRDHRHLIGIYVPHDMVVGRRLIELPQESELAERRRA